MNVWHLLSNRWNSAITEYALSAARSLESVGHRSFFTPLAGSPAAKRASDLGLKTFPVATFSLASLPALIEVHKASRPDVVITYGGPETFLLRCARGSSSARVVRFRGHALGPEAFFSDLKQRVSLHPIDMVLTPSDSMAQAMRNRRLHPRVQSAILGCDTQRYVRKVLHDRSPRPELVIFGRFDPVKGHKEFMVLFAHLLRHHQTSTPKPRLHIVGQPANVTSADLRAAGEALGLEYGADFLITEERVHDVAGLMSSATLGVVSSLGSEVICRVAEEFLLCGTPVVSSDVGSLPEVFREASFGATYGLSQVEEAARTLRHWIDRSWQESETDKLARAQMAKAHFSLETMGQRLDSLFLSL